MDLWQLHIFCKVVEHKSFSRAGETANLSQPTVSSHIKYLENHFGCRLIDRLGREVLPTKAGELLYKHAVKLLSYRDKLETALGDYLGVARGNLVVGGSTIPGNYILPKLIGPFLKVYSDIAVSLRVGDTQTIVEEIITGGLELGVVGARADDQRLVQKKLIEDEMKLIVPAGHPWFRKSSVSLDMVATAPFIVRERGSGTLRSIQNSLAQIGVEMNALRIVAEMGSTTAVCQGIKGGVGISVLSPIAVKEELDAGTMKALPIAGVDLKRNFYLTSHRQRSPSPLGKLFADYLLEAASQKKLPTAER